MVYRHKPQNAFEEKNMIRDEYESKESFQQEMRDAMAANKAKYAGGFYNPNMESYFTGASKTIGHVPGKYYKVQFTSQSGTVDTYIGEKRWEKYGGKEDYKRHASGSTAKSSKRATSKARTGSSGG